MFLKIEFICLGASLNKIKRQKAPVFALGALTLTVEQGAFLPN